MSSSTNEGNGESRCIAFASNRCLIKGNLVEVALKAREAVEQGESDPILIFNEKTSRLVEVDFGVSEAAIRQRFASLSMPDGPKEEEPAEIKRGPGRPKMGVVGREVTLLPRHWEWLDDQPGGASVALRKLVEMAKRANQGEDCLRKAQESVHRFMWAMAGDLPGFEEASRNFYAGNYEVFTELTGAWPKDIRTHLLELVGAVAQARASISRKNSEPPAK
jgi:hypothetical protein